MINHVFTVLICWRFLGFSSFVFRIFSWMARDTYVCRQGLVLTTVRLPGSTLWLHMKLCSHRRTCMLLCFPQRGQSSVPRYHWLGCSSWDMSMLSNRILIDIHVELRSNQYLGVRVWLFVAPPLQQFIAASVSFIVGLLKRISSPGLWNTPEGCKWVFVTTLTSPLYFDTLTKSKPSAQPH